MSLLAGLVCGGVSLVVGDAFLVSFLLLGMASVVAGLGIFSNLSVECLHEWMQLSSMSSSLIVMSLWVGGVSFLCTSKWMLARPGSFSASIFLLMFVSVIFFSTSNWLMLYFFFEVSLFPVLALVLGWGYQPERIQAVTYLLIYTVMASLPMLISLVLVFVDSGSVSSFCFYGGCLFSSDYSSWLFLMMVVAFLVKLPMFTVHTWLPKAHVEAPVSGSMLLAGVLLKFGGYGVLFVTKTFHFAGANGMLGFLMMLSIWGGLVCSAMCLRQVDMKSWIAYSSIGHMALCLAGILSFSPMGWSGGLVLMLGHGLCSPGLFALSAYTYTLFSSRSLFVCRGVLSVVPTLSMVWFLFSSANMAFPPSFNLLGELYLMVSLVSYSMWFIFPLGVMAFVAGAYSLLLYGAVQHGSVSNLSFKGGVLGSSQFSMGFLLWVPLNVLLVGSDVFFVCY